MSRSRTAWVVPTALAFGFAFLYVPILAMVVFSFNNGKSDSSWEEMLSLPIFLA